ncbi:RDD family protein [Roseateles oligotrophus]|uniref:RDD family protein n=1 Tax=Roseateles oligotrophus TaxID=1769250 RepID=A0ABT2YFL5_9BURK|nr:RDD family protein [Roseateles oligotrophus]MCV2368837.1 RDD family protein [Roseateles oligotrophus]
MPELHTPAAKIDPRAWVTPDDLNVAPSLLGLPLATPRQRLLAMGVDLALLATANQLGNFWLLLAAGLALWLWLRQHRPEVFGQSRWFGRKSASGPRPWAWLLVGVFALGGLMQAWQDVRQQPKPALESAADNVEHATDLVDLADHGDPAASAASAALLKEAGDGAEKASDKSSAKSETAEKAEKRARAQARRIERLEAQLERARAPVLYALRDEFNYWVDKIGLSYFWAAVYFTLLPLLWPGQTPGKRLLGLRMIELTGKRLTPLILFKRFGGYAAGLFTGGSGFVQLIWDSNRQAIQDKTAHTVVINARSSARLTELAAGADA